jgi:hypothetical protein
MTVSHLQQVTIDKSRYSSVLIGPLVSLFNAATWADRLIMIGSKGSPHLGHEN